MDNFAVSERESSTLFWGSYPNFFAHTAKCRSSSLVIGSTAFTFSFYGLYPRIPWRTRDERRRFISPRPLFPAVCRRLELVRLDRYTRGVLHPLFPSSFLSPNIVFILFFYYVNSNTSRCHGMERFVSDVHANRRITSISNVGYECEVMSYRVYPPNKIYFEKLREITLTYCYIKAFWNNKTFCNGSDIIAILKRFKQNYLPSFKIGISLTYFCCTF